MTEGVLDRRVIIYDGSRQPVSVASAVACLGASFWKLRATIYRPTLPGRQD
ncbi:MAG TPA: hypothetical protein VFM14_10700 [Gemmatimonadales bacterium]|nr:hypothetical protein [Gemmatimonadales bacterium]